MSGEKYFIIEKNGVQIHLFADTDLDDVILNRQELYKVFKEAGFEVKEAPAMPPYESFVTKTKPCVSNGDCESCNLLYGDCDSRKGCDIAKETRGSRDD